MDLLNQFVSLLKYCDFGFILIESPHTVYDIVSLYIDDKIQVISKSEVSEVNKSWKSQTKQISGTPKRLEWFNFTAGTKRKIYVTC